MNAKEKIKTAQEAFLEVNKWKKDNYKVVFTNGCFDILHLGHVDYLEKAKALGHKLILGLNTDASVSRIKGPLRPVVDEYARSRIMASLQFIDLIVLFDEETPYDLIKLLLPDILVKGNDYTPENIVGADIVLNNGGKIETIPLIQGYSTTNIISKIKLL